MQIDAAKKYIGSTVKTPFFLFVSDGKYSSVMDELVVFGLALVKTSDFCGEDDKLPDIDGLIEHIKTADVNAKDKRFAVVGLGEYLALRGRNEASRVLSQLKDLNIGRAKVILLLRGLASQIAELQTDLRFDNRRFDVIDRAGCDLSFTVAAPSVGLSALPGFKALLSELENGRCGSVVVNTAVNLDNSMFTIHKVTNAYEGVKFTLHDFNLPRCCGNDAYWAELLTDLQQSNGIFDGVLDRHGVGANLETDFYTRIAGADYRNWLYFMALKSKVASLSNGYLRFVLEMTNFFEDFRANILNMIVGIPHSDKRFALFYTERKNLIERYPESYVADFVINNRKVISESIYKLTDGTKTEREEIIAWLAENGKIPYLENIYPALADYLKKYVFKCPELAVLLTEYFDAYKRQKLYNELEPEFLMKVKRLAHSREFNRLPTRNEILDKVDKDASYLYWLDALGVEYLAYIEALVQKRGLSISISICRAELPTITSINRDFYDEWLGQKEKNNELDDIKHRDAGGYNFTNNKLPIHLAKELDVIAAVVDRAATGLALRHYKRFLIVSDHGASRLAVLRRKEELYETDTRGEHSGRCCKTFEPYDLPFAIEENGYLVLADYGRFKGSRAANVEVHGGASLEEVVIPVIELTLKDRNITVELVDEAVLADFRLGAKVELFINVPVQSVSVVIDGKRYAATPIDANHYTVKLPDVKRAGDYPADVYAGDNLIGNILIRTQGKSGKVNDTFDELF